MEPATGYSLERHGRYLAWITLPFLVISCGQEEITRPPERTDLEVTVSVTGHDRDLNGYTVTLDGTDSRPIGGVRTATVSSYLNLTAGTHELELSDITDNCRVSGDNPRSVTVTEGQVTSESFEVTCSRTEKIAFVRTAAGPRLFVMHADGQDQFPLTFLTVHSDADILFFGWSPSTMEIAFTSEDDLLQLPFIGVIGEPSWEPQSLTAFDLDSERVTHRPVWSPGGNQIAFQSERAGAADVWVVNADGTGERNLTGDLDADAVSPGWSPDGSRIVFGSGGEVWTMTSDGSGKKALTDTELASAVNPSWSPDGSRIAFLGSLDGETAELWSVETDGSSLSQLTTDARLDADVPLRWAPDGARLAFHSERTGNSEIWVIDADGSNLRNLSDHPDDDMYPEWSSDGSQIVFASTRSGVQALWIMNSNGSVPRQITDDSQASGDAAPAWRPPGPLQHPTSER